MKMNELKPCPFCGENRMLEIRSKERKDRDKCKFTAEVQRLFACVVFLQLAIVVLIGLKKKRKKKQSTHGIEE